MNIPEDFKVLTHQTASTGQWRGRQADKYPRDSARNREASRRLAELALTPFADIDPAAWQELAPLTKGRYFLEACSEVTKSISFRFHPNDMDDVVRAVADYARGYELPGASK